MSIGPWCCSDGSEYEKSAQTVWQTVDSHSTHSTHSLSIVTEAVDTPSSPSTPLEGLMVEMRKMDSAMGFKLYEAGLASPTNGSDWNLVTINAVNSSYVPMKALDDIVSHWRRQLLWDSYLYPLDVHLLILCYCQGMEEGSHLTHLFVNVMRQNIERDQRMDLAAVCEQIQNTLRDEGKPQTDIVFNDETWTLQLKQHREKTDIPTAAPLDDATDGSTAMVQVNSTTGDTEEGATIAIEMMSEDTIAEDTVTPDMIAGGESAEATLENETADTPPSREPSKECVDARSGIQPHGF